MKSSRGWHELMTWTTATSFLVVFRSSTFTTKLVHGGVEVHAHLILLLLPRIGEESWYCAKFPACV